MIVTTEDQGTTMMATDCATEWVTVRIWKDEFTGVTVETQQRRDTGEVFRLFHAPAGRKAEIVNGGNNRKQRRRLAAEARRG